MAGSGNNPAGRAPTVDPQMGITNPYFRTSDLQRDYTKGISVINASAVNVRSVAQNTNCRGVELVATFSDALTSCDISVYRVDPGPVDTLMKTYIGVKFNNANNLFFTGAEGIDLKGLPMKVDIANIAGGGTVTILVKVMQ